MMRPLAILAMALGLALPLLGCGRYGPPVRSVEPPTPAAGVNRGHLPTSIPGVSEDDTFQ